MQHRLAHREPTFALLVQETHEHDAVEHGYAEHRDEPDGRGHRQVLAGQEQGQQAADGREGHVGQDQGRELDRVERGVQQHEDEEDRDRHDQAQLGQGALLVLERTAPLDPVAGRQVHLRLDRRRGIGHEAIDIPAPNVHLNHGIALQLLATDERIALGDRYRRNLGQRHQRSRSGLERNPSQRFDRTARTVIKAHGDVEPPHAVQQHADRFATQAIAHDGQHFLGVHAVPGQLGPIHLDADLRLTDVRFQREVGDAVDTGKNRL